MSIAWTPTANEQQSRISSVKDDRLRAAAETRLGSSHHYAIRRIRCDVVSGVVVLTGVVSSYYIKQLAQEAVMGINYQSGVENRLEVE